MNYKMTVSEKNAKIADIVFERDTSDESIQFLNECKEIHEKVAITHSPLSSVAIAALAIIGVENNESEDENVKYYKEVFSSISIWYEK